MNARQLRKLVLEVLNEEKTKLTSKKYSIKRLYEQEEQQAAAEPQGTQFTNQSNFKDFDDAMIDELFAQIMSKDPKQPIFNAMSFQGDDGETVSPDPNKIAGWLESTGPDAVRERIKAVGAAIPAQGLPKSEMPFLPGPPDAQGSVSDVQDALTPGGEYNIAFAEGYKKSEKLILERWSNLAGINEVAPPPKNTLEPGTEETEKYLKSGHPENDGKPEGNDDANVQMPAQISASEAVPTQSNILLPKALGMAANGVSGGDLGAYFSTNNEILDGHHRWAATMLNNPGANIGGFAAIDLEAMGGTTQALKHLTALGNALGNKTKTK